MMAVLWCVALHLPARAAGLRGCMVGSSSRGVGGSGDVRRLLAFSTAAHAGLPASGSREAAAMVRRAPGCRSGSYGLVDGTGPATLATTEGRLKRTLVPPPGAGAAAMAPPWASTIFRHTARPMPQPS
jgi:hypothetical protein